MTGDDSYHAHCFKCKVCHNRIDELVFAKTSHGIYCMNCHNERMAKIRRHAQRKREKEKTSNATTSSSTRDREARELLAGNTVSPPSTILSVLIRRPAYQVSDQPQHLSPLPSLRSKPSAPALRDAPSSQSLHVSIPEVAPTPTRKRRSVSPVDRTPAIVNGSQSTVTTPTERQPDSRPQPTSLHPLERSQSFIMTVAPPETNHTPAELPVSINGNPRAPTPAHGFHPLPSAEQLQSTPANLTASSSHLSPISATAGTSLLQRRKSYDDGVRPLSVLLGKNTANQDKKDVVDKLPIGGLSVPGQTSRADRRRSINPGLALQYKDTAPQLCTTRHGPLTNLPCSL
ncbi:hypothetical protein J3R83DRAFT_3696 [Lanmaoa asiatica]|nr:hypothetical protein J3R83DRAFT_3696 [Lanmaoa asiatica]